MMQTHEIDRRLITKNITAELTVEDVIRLSKPEFTIKDCTTDELIHELVSRCKSVDLKRQEMNMPDKVSVGHLTKLINGRLESETCTIDFSIIGK